MAQLSPMRAGVPKLEGLQLLHRGKVRDSYKLDGLRRLPVATDGISIFDFVLNALVPEKGRILNAMSHFWFKFLESKGAKTHMITAGSEIDVYLPENLRENLDLQCRAMVVHELEMIPIEFIARNCLTGSVLAEYRKSGTVYGTRLESDLQDGDSLEIPLFTPTTKAEEGHDQETNAENVRSQYAEGTFRFLENFAQVSVRARESNIIMADGKGEGGYDKNGFFRQGDEFGTPDSSRFWDAIAHAKSRMEEVRKAPPPFDKQLVRAWGIEQGINKLNPSNMLDVQLVHEMQVPEELLAATTATYRYIFWRLTGQRLEDYARNEMDMKLEPRRRKLAIVFGSENDIPMVAHELKSIETSLKDGIERMDVHVISCHRNPVELDAFAASGCGGADVIIAAGGKALALPGVLDALLHNKGRKIPVIGVALAKEGSRSEKAAMLSIEELPGEPVIIEEMNGRAYTGVQGFNRALHRVAYGEFPPAKPRTPRQVRLNVDLSKY